MSSPAPVIGSYRKPATTGEARTDASPEPQVVDNRPKVESPSRSLTEGLQEDLKSSIDRTKDAAEKAKTYAEILSERDIPLAKAHAIVDAMLEKGFYDETLEITKSTSVTFRTRTHSDYIRYLRAVEVYNPKFVEEQQEIQIRYFLAASLVAFKGQTFTHPEADKLFDSKLEWLEKQPERLVSLLAVKLNKFDQKIQLVMSEGIVENF